MPDSTTDVLAAAKVGDRGAIRTLHDRYAGRLYDHCSAVLRDPDAAADAMVDTFVLGIVEVARLRDPETIEPWLFALAGDQLLYRPRTPVELPDRHHSDASVDEQARALTWEAVGWLTRRDRILLDLDVRQRLGRESLARAVGVSLSHACARSERLRERVDREIGALLVARLAPGCPELAHVPEHALDPRTTTRRLVHHVDRCATCSGARLDLPRPVELLADVPPDREPPELRAEVLERIHRLLLALEDDSGTAVGDRATDDDGGDVDEDDADYDPYEVVQELTPPPVPLRSNGFPRSVFPERRRAVLVATVLIVGAIGLASVFDLRGAGSGAPSLLAAGAATAVTTPPSTTPGAASTTAPVATSTPDTTPPALSSLATTYACIGPLQRTTEAIATVSDDGGVKNVDLIVTHDVLGQSRLRMIESAGRYAVAIGPFSADGTVNWTVEATDQSGNVATRSGPPVAVSPSC